MKRAAFLAMLTMASGGIAAVGVAWLAARRLSGAELGFFFSFLSFGTLVQFGDFGLTAAALQAAGKLVGTRRLQDLPALARRVGLWSLIATLLAAIVVAVLAWATFSRGAANVSLAWFAPWFSFLLALAVNQLTVARIAVREGAGKINAVWTLRLIQDWSGGIVCIASLHYGGGLWSLFLSTAIRAVIAIVWIAIVDPLRVSDPSATYPLERWMADIWPFQWKIGVSGLAGYFIFRAFAPIIMLEKGPVAAGQFGLAIAVMNLLIAVTAAWPQSETARFAALHADGRTGEIVKEFPSLLWVSTAVSALAAASLASALWVARSLGITVALRLPDAITTSIIIGTAVIHHYVLCFATFLRSEGREPMLMISVVGSVITVTAIWLAARFGTLRDIAYVNLACALVGIPVVHHLFRARVR